MEPLVEIASNVLRDAEARLEVVSGNVANVVTPGYRASVSFSQQVSENLSLDNNDSFVDQQKYMRLGQATLTMSNDPFHFALSGPGMFRVTDGEQDYYTRDGQFSIDSNGMLVDVRGMHVTDDAGGDIRLSGGPVEVTSDGVILQDGLPQARIGVFQLAENGSLDSIGGALFSMDEVEVASGTMVRQGMLEGSNVVLADEMVEMMAAVRHAEMGSQLVRIYDSLMGRVFTALGQ